ncbi:MAG: metal-dependent hydrolase [Erythrobacter sp.]|nr:metal-dependent hydrolase [Erythrobacter sp.]
MDNLTHSLVGAVLGQAGLKRTTGLAMPALIIGANLPDVDAACFFWLEGTEHLAFRRGITHGPPALVLLPLILAGILWGWDRWQTKRGTRPEARLPVRFGWLYAMAFIGCLSHPFFDWLNVYGIRLLEPFSSQWFYGDTLFIIDVWLWAMLIGSVWWSRRREKAGAEWMRPARVGIAVGLAYIGVNGAITWLDYKMRGTRTEPYPIAYVSAPVPLEFWRREKVAMLHDGRWISSDWDGTDFGYGYANSKATQCKVRPFTEAPGTKTQLDAFLFWSRAPFAVRAEDGSVILYDARFYDPRARDRFSVVLPDVRCEELPTP